MRKINAARTVGKRKAKEIEMKNMGDLPPIEPGKLPDEQDLPTPPKQDRIPEVSDSEENTPTPPSDDPKEDDDKPGDESSNIAAHIVCDIALLQQDIGQLREVGYKTTSFRLTKREIKWMKHKALDLDEIVLRGKIDMVHIVRLGIKLTQKLLEKDKKTIVKILEQTK